MVRRANRRGVRADQYPSLERLHAKVMGEEGIPRIDPIPPMSVRVFRNVLLHMGIKFQKRCKSGDPLLMDDPRILRLRATYFTLMFEAEISGAVIFYLDERQVEVALFHVFPRFHVLFHDEYEPRPEYFFPKLGTFLRRVFVLFLGGGLMDF